MRYWHIVFSIGLLLFISACNNNNQTNNSIGIIALGDVNTVYIDSIKEALERTYNKEVIVLNKQKIPKQFFVTVKSPRYRADSIIRYLKKIKPDSISHVLGFTAFDISTTKKDSEGNILKPEYKYKDWGIFGLGYMPGESCVVSSFRLKHKNKAVFISRLQKVSIHEVGHNMGLHHCDNKDCVMTDAVERISTIDNESFELCGECKREIGL